MLTIVCYANLWVNKVSVRFFKQMKNKNKKEQVKLYRFGINGLIHDHDLRQNFPISPQPNTRGIYTWLSTRSSQSHRTPNPTQDANTIPTRAGQLQLIFNF